MKKLLVILAVVLIFIACDRFEHDFFDKTESFEGFVTGLVDDIEGESTGSVENYFADDYLNDGVNKDSMITLINEYLENAENVEFQTNGEQPYTISENTASINFDFKGQYQDNNDYSLEWEDEAELIGEEWILSGNKSSGEGVVLEVIEEFASAFADKDVAYLIHDNYLNDGKDKEALLADYEELFAEMDAETEVALANTDIMLLGSRAKVEFDLNYEDVNDNQVNREFSDYVLSENNEWLFYGNQESPEIKKHVLLEMWTGVI